MTARTARRTASVPASRAGSRDDARQLIAVVILLAVALAAGLLLKSISESQTRTVTAGGVTAAVPGDWIYQPGAGDVAFVANDPRIAGHRYVVSHVDAAGRTLRDVVGTHAGAKSQLFAAYQPIAREQVTIGGRTGESVTYAFVVERAGQVPQVIQARDVYLEGGDRILVISTEAPADRFADSTGAFDAFVQSVRV